MANLTVTQVLDDALLNIQDNSATIRVRFLNWLNNAIQDIAIERDWQALQTSVDISVLNNRIAKPVDYGRCVQIHNVASDYIKFCVTTQHKLSDVESAQMSNRLAGGILWSEDSTGIIFNGTVTFSSATLVYIPALTNYTEADTLPFPATFSNYFQRAILTTYYEWDMDERMSLSANLQKVSLKQLKHMENQLMLARAGWSKSIGLVNTDAR